MTDSDASSDESGDERQTRPAASGSDSDGDSDDDRPKGRGNKQSGSHSVFQRENVNQKSNVEKHGFVGNIWKISTIYIPIKIFHL